MVEFNKWKGRKNVANPFPHLHLDGKLINQVNLLAGGLLADKCTDCPTVPGTVLIFVETKCLKPRDLPATGQNKKLHFGKIHHLLSQHRVLPILSLPHFEWHRFRASMSVRLHMRRSDGRAVRYCIFVRMCAQAQRGSRLLSQR